jgi:hypothetical protein
MFYFHDTLLFSGRFAGAAGHCLFPLWGTIGIGQANNGNANTQKPVCPYTKTTGLYAKKMRNG